MSIPIKKRSNHEALEQTALIQWANYHPICKWLHHSPNGGSRNLHEAANLKRQGVRSGFPDLFLPYPAKGFHGLFIEMKSKAGRVSENQQLWIDQLNEWGYLAKVTYGFEEAKKLLLDYIG